MLSHIFQIQRHIPTQKSPCGLIPQNGTDQPSVSWPIYHGHGGQPLLCLYQDCFCSFRAWGSLRSHLSRHHLKGTQVRFRSAESISFTCPCCNAKTISTERELFEHLGQHLKKHETVICVFQNCNFSTNIYGTFASHRSRKHTPHSLMDFKEDIIKRFVSSANKVVSCLMMVKMMIMM